MSTTRKPALGAVAVLAMLVEENLLLGGWTFRRDRTQVRQKLEANYERFPAPRDKSRQATGELSGGEQRMVEIG